MTQATPDPVLEVELAAAARVMDLLAENLAAE